MRLEDNFREVVMEQSGYFTIEQAERLNGSSRKYFNRLALKDKEIERIEQGIYRFKLIEESNYSDIIIMGLKAKGRAAISHKSALSYWNMSDEVPYNIYMKAFDSFKKKDIRKCKDAIISTSGNVLSADNTNDYYNFGEFYITTPTRTLFDCVVDDCIQIESLKECLSDGKFNPYLLSDEQKNIWDNHPFILHINKEKQDSLNNLKSINV